MLKNPTNLWRSYRKIIAPPVCIFSIMVIFPLPDPIDIDLYGSRIKLIGGRKPCADAVRRLGRLLIEDVLVRGGQFQIVQYLLNGGSGNKQFPQRRKIDKFVPFMCPD